VYEEVIVSVAGVAGSGRLGSTPGGEEEWGAGGGDRERKVEDFGEGVVVVGEGEEEEEEEGEDTEEVGEEGAGEEDVEEVLSLLALLVQKDKY
jgi:hypothetical protein